MPPFKTIHRLKVTITGTKPPIWRRLEAPSSMTLADLHAMIQVVFGWADCHLHGFDIGGVEYGADGDDELGDIGVPFRPEGRAKLAEVAPNGSRFSYTYDFGDNWQHRIEIEDVVPREQGVRYPQCTAGRRAGPPEDVGGVWRYREFVEAIKDPSHPEHETMLDWVGGQFDPENFDCGEVNLLLA